MVSSFLCFNFPDIPVTKAGPGTIAEASICGLPCILSSFLPGQEEGYVPYVMDNGFGCYRGSPEGIADTVEEWFASTRAKGSMLERMRDIQRIGCGEAGRDA
jgi:UDP-N-acetylglucosamine:LPS N-acetylglucosamine transferase